MPKVLLIDDSKAIQKVANLILEKSPYTLISAETSQNGEALALKERPDIILVDLTIGKEDGLHLIESFKANPLLKNTKIILLHTHLKKVHEEFLNKVRIDGKLAKPFDPKEFLNVLNDLPASSSAPLVVDMPKDEFQSLFDEEDLEKSLEFIQDVPSNETPQRTVEKVCREVIPPLAEKIIREEIQKLLAEKE